MEFQILVPLRVLRTKSHIDVPLVRVVRKEIYMYTVEPQFYHRLFNDDQHSVCVTETSLYTRQLFLSQMREIFVLS